MTTTAEATGAFTDEEFDGEYNVYGGDWSEVAEEAKRLGQQRIVVNMGLGEAVQNAKIVESAVEELTAITGRKPVVTRAKKSIASFKLREGMPIGVMVTLRGEQMYDFLDRERSRNKRPLGFAPQAT